MKAFGYQQRSYDCGLHAFSNAMRVLGVEYSYNEAKELAGTTARDGTSEQGIIQGIIKAGFKAKEYSSKNPSAAWRWLLNWARTFPVIVYVNGDHWTTITGRVENKVVMVDPNADVDNGENGVYPLTKREMLERWEIRGGFYAIKVYR